MGTATSYRQQAAALRAVADRMKEPENATAARSVADKYDQLAMDLVTPKPAPATT